MERALVMAQELASLADEALLALIRHGQEAALGALYDRYGRLVYSVALRITADRQTAEEVVQDVFQTVWQAAAGFQPERGSFSGWLLGITRHRAIDTMRSRRERARAREQALDPAWTGQSSAPDRGLAELPLREVVRAALAELPDSQRQAIELAYYGGLSGSEIATTLGAPPGTIKTRLRLGLLKLRDLLRSPDEE